MKAIYLIGFMGAGKTTVSKKLAGKLSVNYYDTDKEIVKAAGKSINDIFAAQGEKHFRQLESAVLQAMPENDAVVATGGGIIVSAKNRQLMREKGIVVFLYANINETLERLAGDDSRPLLQGNKLQSAESLFTTRLPLYRQAADVEIDTTSKDVSDIVDEILQRMKQ